jgi:PST family polysaccharide transporter
MLNLKSLRKAAPEFFSQIRSRDGFKDVLKNSGWLFLDKGVRAVLGLLVGAWVARYLGPTQFGELSYYLAVIAVIQSVTTLGMDGVVVREIAKTPAGANAILATAFWMRLLTGIVCWTLVLIGFAITDPENKQGLWILGIVGASLLFQSSDVIDLWFQGTSQNKRGVYAKLSAYLLGNAIKVALIYLDAELMDFAIVVAVEAAFVSLALYVSYRFYPCKDSWIKNWILARQLITESWPYLLSVTSILIYMKADQIMIKEMLGEHELGLYSAVLPFATIWNVIPVIICAVLMPYLSRIRVESNNEFDRYLVYLFRSFWLISISLVLIINLASSFIIGTIYGSAYQEAIPILNIYILTIIPVFLGVAQNIWIINEGKARLLLLQTATGAAASIALNFIFISFWGLEGAAIAAVLSQFMSAVLTNLIFAKKLFMMQFGVAGS